MASHSLVSSTAKPEPVTRRERPVFSMSDDHAMSKKILDTHSPNGREVDVAIILQVIEEIFQHAFLAIDGVLQVNGCLDNQCYITWPVVEGYYCLIFQSLTYKYILSVQIFLSHYLVIKMMISTGQVSFLQIRQVTCDNM